MMPEFDATGPEPRNPFCIWSICSCRSSLATVAAWLITLVALGNGVDVARADDLTVTYSRDIQPILAKHCVLCHGPDEAEAGLRLDQQTRATAVLDSGDHAIVPGDPDASELLRRVTSTDETVRMPPEGEPLTESEVAKLRTWIAGDALFEQHWAYRSVTQPPLPAVSDDAWVRNPIDRFVLAKLERLGVAPSPAADPATSIKRLSYDLLGLPPSLAEVDAFVADPSESAYEAVVDRYLASEHFGERWGRHWLDKARYADSDGYEKDRPRPNAWRYRDWVIDAINRDMPFDQFTIEQLAGDLLPNPSPMQKLATAFHRQTLTNTEGGVDQEQFRVEATFDRTETTGAVWMGLTMTCARCHTHKYDQIMHREYYELFAFFDDADEVNTDVLRDANAKGRYEHEKAVYDAEVAVLAAKYDAAKAKLNPQIDAWIDSIQTQRDAGTGDDPLSELPMPVAEALRTVAAERSPEQRAAIADHVASLDPTAAKLATQLAERRKNAPQSPNLSVRVMAPAERTTRLLFRGDFLQPAEEVTTAALAVLTDAHPLRGRKPDLPSDRLDLARWLVDANHPLTPRVTVNHVWALLFGRGIVGTVNDFGVRGDVPTHPQLLDWLAWRLPREMAWSRKTLIKTIVMSATYRQSSRHRPELRESDPINHLLARQNRMRVSGEVVRDLYLSVSGLLSRKVGGPSVFPPLPSGVAELSYANNFKWKTSEGEDAYRRGMYTFFKRTSPYPTLVSFDCPDSNTTRLQRETSNTPLQALVTLNNDVFTQSAQAFAVRVLREAGASDEERLVYAMRLCLARTPNEHEVAVFMPLLASARKHYEANEQDAVSATERYRAASVGVAENAAWVATLRMVLNLDEFIVRN